MSYLFIILILVNQCLLIRSIPISKSTNSLHEYGNADETTLTPTKPNLIFNISTSPNLDTSASDILLSVYEAKKQLPSIDRMETSEQLQPTYRFALDFLKNKFSKKKFSVSDMFEKAGHHLATKLFGSNEKYGDSYKKTEYYQPQMYDSNSEYPMTPAGYNAFITENYQTTPYGYTVAYSKGEQISNTDDFQETKNCKTETKSKRKNQMGSRLGGKDDYGNEGYEDEGYDGGYEMSYGGGGKEIIAELKEKLKSLFMLVLPLVPIALILATVIPSSVFVPTRSGGSTLLPLNGTSGINLMQLTPGTTANLPAKRKSEKFDVNIRGEDYAKRMKSFNSVEKVLAVAESSGILNATMKKLVENLSVSFAKYAENVMKTSNLNSKKKAMVMDKILRRIGQDLIRSLNGLNMEKIKSAVKSNNNKTETNKKMEHVKNSSKDGIDVLNIIPQIFDQNRLNDMLDPVLRLYQAVNKKPDLISSMLNLLPQSSDERNLTVELMDKKNIQKRSALNDDEDRISDSMLKLLESDLRLLLNEKKENSKKKKNKQNEVDDDDEIRNGNKKSFTEKATSTWNTVKDQLHAFLSRSDDDPNCLQRLICQNAHLGQEEEANLPQRVLWKIVTRLENIAPSQFGIRTLMKNAKYGRCKRYYCPLAKLQLSSIFL